MSGRSSAASQGSSRLYQSPRDKKLLCVSLVSGENVLLPYDKRTTVGDIFTRVCEQKDIRDATMFGVAVRVHSFYLFLRHEIRVERVKFKEIRKKNGAAAHNEEQPLQLQTSGDATPATYEQYTNNRVHFLVKFYVRTNALPEKAAKMYYYLQIRENVLQYNMLLNESTIFQLIAFSLQADYGSYRTDLGTAKKPYFDVRKYCPIWLIERYGADWLLLHLPTQHASLGLMTQSEAVFRYIRLASEVPNTAHNQHVIRVTEKGPANGSLFLGIGPSGISLYEPRNVIHVFMVHASTLPWADIVRLRCQRKRLEIVPKGGRSLVMGFATASQAEYILWLCKELHRYQLLSQMYASSTRRAVEADEMTPHREKLVVPSATTQLLASTAASTADPFAAAAAATSVDEDDDDNDVVVSMAQDYRGFGYSNGAYGFSEDTRQIADEGIGVGDAPLRVAAAARDSDLAASERDQLSASLPLLPEVAALKDRLRLRGVCGGGLNLSLPLLTGLLSSEETGSAAASSSAFSSATAAAAAAAAVQRHHSSVESATSGAAGLVGGRGLHHSRKQVYVNLGATVDDLSLLTNA